VVWTGRAGSEERGSVPAGSLASMGDGEPWTCPSCDAVFLRVGAPGYDVLEGRSARGTWVFGYPRTGAPCSGCVGRLRDIALLQACPAGRVA
jgi:hypothetical protein